MALEREIGLIFRLTIMGLVNDFPIRDSSLMKKFKAFVF